MSKIWQKEGIFKERFCQQALLLLWLLDHLAQFWNIYKRVQELFQESLKNFFLSILKNNLLVYIKFFVFPYLPGKESRSHFSRSVTRAPTKHFR